MNAIYQLQLQKTLRDIDVLKAKIKKYETPNLTTSLSVESPGASGTHRHIPNNGLTLKENKRLTVGGDT